MSKLPSLTGKEIIAALKKIGFEVVRIRGTIIFSHIGMDARPLFLCMLEKRRGPGCSPKSYATAN